MDTVWNAILTIVTTLWNFISTFVLEIAGLFPFGKLILIIAIIVLVWIYILPRRAKAKIKPHLVPAFWITSTPIRWLFVQAVANKEWLRQASDGKPTIIEVPVESPKRMRRTLWQWLMSQLRTIAFTIIVILMYKHWDTIRPLFTR